MLDPSKSHPGFPSRKETAQIFRVHGLLYEEVHLPSHTEHCSLLHTLQLLLQSHQNTLSHLVKTLVIAAGRIKKEKQGLQVWILNNVNNIQSKNYKAREQYSKRKVRKKCCTWLFFQVLVDQYQVWSSCQPHPLASAANTKLSRGSWSSRKEDHRAAPTQ